MRMIVFNDTKLPAAVVYICNGEIVLFFVFRIFDEGRNSMCTIYFC